MVRSHIRLFEAASHIIRTYVADAPATFVKLKTIYQPKSYNPDVDVGSFDIFIFLSYIIQVYLDSVNLTLTVKRIPP